MHIGKLCLTAFLAAMPAVAVAQPSVTVDVGVNAGVDSYDTVAPGDPVESVDVFYDQLSPYGVWVDEPDVGRVFVPDEANYVPYTNGHWQYTSVGMVWVSSEPHAWATSHYGRWAYSNEYGRWYWMPDTQWGPAWVEWRETGEDFGWAPLAPEVVVRRGWQPPVESWHYCGSGHLLDANVTRYYEPRARVVEIHRQARPIEHYSTVSNVRVVVGPSSATLREHRVAARPVRVEARTVGRWSPAEAHAQVERAHEHQATFEVQNQHRIESNTRLHAAQVKVIDTHPQIKAQVNVRVQAGGRPAEPQRAEPNRAEPNRGVPQRAEPQRAEPNRPEPNRAEPNRPAPQRPEPQRAEPSRPEPNRPAPERKPPEPAHTAPAAPAPRPAPAPHEEHAPAQHAPAPQESRPAPAAPAQHAPAPARQAPQQKGGEHERGDEHKEPEHH